MLAQRSDGFLSLHDAAKWAAVSERTMLRWVRRGLPVFQAGPRSKLLIKSEDIERFLTKRQAKPVLDHLVEDTLRDLSAGSSRGN